MQAAMIAVSAERLAVEGNENERRDDAVESRETPSMITLEKAARRGRRERFVARESGHAVN